MTANIATDIAQLTITEARARLDAGELSAPELLEAQLAHIEAHDPEIHAFLEVFTQQARRQAQAAQRQIEAQKATPLTGIPIALKDNILVAGERVSAASRILESYVAPYDATVVKRLKEAGAVLLGRTNMDEFAMGGSTENSAYGPTKNPHDLTRVPGGSSGGSAAAVAAGMSIAALGTDTGGSVRQPASFCGVVGLKPTYGRVSRFGIIAMGSSLDQVGPLTKTVTDAEILYQAIAGQDPHDATTLPSTDNEPNAEVRRIGVPMHLLEKGVTTEVQEHYQHVITQLQKQGYEIVEISLPHVADALQAYYIIMPAEVSTNLARFDGMRYGRREAGESYQEIMAHTRGAGFGAEVKRRILIGTFVLSAGYADAYYHKARALREKIRADFANAFESVDVILTPTAPEPAFTLGAKADPVTMYAADLFTVPANIAGVPALSVPTGFVEVGEVHDVRLPVGTQIIAPMRGEGRLFAIGRILEAMA